MIPVAFLICALALPPEGQIGRLVKLKAYLELHAPAKELYFTQTGNPSKKDGWERLPFTFEGFRIYARAA